MTTAAERVQALNEAAFRRYHAIDADERLSADAKVEDKIRAFGKLDRDIKAIHAAEVAARETRRISLERDLFGLRPTATASDVVAHRDAVERAQTLTKLSDAARAMQTARDIGDDQLVRAIAAQAIEQGWDALVGAYVGEIRPDAASKIAELTRMASGGLGADLSDMFAWMPAIPSGVGTSSTKVLEFKAAALHAQDGVYPATPAVDQATIGLLSMLVNQIDAGEAPTTDYSGAILIDDDSFFETS